MSKGSRLQIIATAMAVVGLLILLCAIVLKTLAVLFVVAACLFVAAMLATLIELPRRAH